MCLPKMLIQNTLKCKLSNGGRESNILLCKAEYVLKSLCTRCTVMKLYITISFNAELVSITSSFSCSSPI